MKSNYVQALSAKEMRETNGGFLCCFIIKAIICAILNPCRPSNPGDGGETVDPGNPGGGED